MREHISRKDALELLKNYNKEPFHIQYALTVDSWDYDYKMLKHVRWVRNNIAHGNGSSECSENDIKYVKDFYQRIMQQKDRHKLSRCIL